MFVTYTPADGGDARTWEFKPGSVRASRAQMVEKRLRELVGEARTYEQFKSEVVQGSAAARRVLLWHLTSLDHPTVRIDDIDPTGDELLVEHSRSELEEIRAALAKSHKLDDQTRDLMLEALDAQIATAKDDGGKAPSNSSETSTP